jgi:hypothetical protein
MMQALIPLAFLRNLGFPVSRPGIAVGTLRNSLSLIPSDRVECLGLPEETREALDRFLGGRRLDSAFNPNTGPP